MKEKERILWVDQLRGISMLAILLLHSEMYYVKEDIINYNLYVPNALIIFYFISGYLFKQKETFNWQNKIHSIFYKLIVPYFLFTLLLAVPKAYMNDLSINEVLTRIVLGNGSWFIASLIVAEIIFCFVLRINKAYLTHSIPFIALIAAWLLTDSYISQNHNYWNYHSAMIGLFFIYLGYIYHQKKDYFSAFFNPFYIVIYLLLIIGIKYYEQKTSISLLIAPVAINNYFVFVIDMLLTIPLMISIGKILPEIKPIKWTGHHSLYFYFFCGAVPSFIAFILEKINFPYNQQYWRILTVFLLVWLLSSIIVRCILYIKQKI